MHIFHSYNVEFLDLTYFRGWFTLFLSFLNLHSWMFDKTYPCVNIKNADAKIEFLLLSTYHKKLPSHSWEFWQNICFTSFFKKFNYFKVLFQQREKQFSLPRTTFSLCMTMCLERLNKILILTSKNWSIT